MSLLEKPFPLPVLVRSSHFVLSPRHFHLHFLQQLAGFYINLHVYLYNVRSTTQLDIIKESVFLTFLSSSVWAIVVDIKIFYTLNNE